MEGLGRELGDYSVALAFMKGGKVDGFRPLGSGVLVRRGHRFGILTARHCLHSPESNEVSLGSSGSDKLLLILRGGRGIQVNASEVFEHDISTPKTEQFGPDLAFVEILPGNRLDTFKAIGSFWSLDKDVTQIIDTYGGNGKHQSLESDFRGFITTQYSNQNLISHAVRHMAYAFIILDGDVYERTVGLSR